MNSEQTTINNKIIKYYRYIGNAFNYLYFQIGVAHFILAFVLI